LNKVPVNKAVKIAVLPFQILGGDEQLEVLMTGFSDDLITNLSKFVGLSVISRLSTAHIKDFGSREAIEKLRVGYLVTGSTRKHQEELHITVKLIRADDFSVVFAEKHTIQYSKLLEIQDTLLERIVSVLQGEINYNLLSHSYKKNEVNLEVYEHYLRGMDLLRLGSVESDEKARSFFQAAIDLDPHYALAYTGMSLTYFNEWSCQLWERWDVCSRGAHEYALKALELDQNDYVALAVLGRTYLYQEEFELAEHHARKSLRMNPNDAANLLAVAYVLSYLGHPEESLSLYHKAVELNPLRKDKYLLYGAHYSFETGQFEEAAEMMQRLDIRGQWVDFPAFVAANAYHLGRMEDVWKYWNIFLELFREKIYAGTGDLETEALNWQMEINPYVDENNNLQPFWDFVRKERSLGKARERSETTLPAALFQFNNGIWEMVYESQKVMINDAKGFHDLHKLLSEPNRELNCLDLMGAVVDEQHGAELIDDTAKRSYRKRVTELQAAMEEADAQNNTVELDSLRSEYETLLAHLSASMGLSGRSRASGATLDKARSAVTWRIRAAIKKIGGVHPGLAKYLTNTIKTGSYCSYQPDRQIDWVL
jgi:TolB-like protein/Tfp pilus assembly protein PilF